MRAVSSTHVLFGVGVLQFHATYGRWLQILESTFARVEREAIVLPTHWELGEVARRVGTRLDEPHA